MGGNIVSIHTMNQNVSTANHFDYDLPLELIRGDLDPFDMPTPFFDTILKAQNWDDKSIDAFYSLIGRTLHDVGKLDNIQIALYLIGIAGSGKSCFFRTWSEVYPKERIGHLAVDSSGTFAFEHLADSWIVFGLDITNDFKLTSAHFNSFTSGEEYVRNRKFKLPDVEAWTAQLVFASNVFPPIESRGGSGARRLVIFEFDRKVIVSDTRLMEKCRAELPLMVAKTTLLYHRMLERLGDQSIWDSDILPAQCTRLSNEYLIASSPLVAFFNDENLVTIDKSKYAVTNDVRDSYRKFVGGANQNHMRKKTHTTFGKTALVGYLGADVLWVDKLELVKVPDDSPWRGMISKLLRDGITGGVVLGIELHGEFEIGNEAARLKSKSAIDNSNFSSGPPQATR